MMLENRIVRRLIGRGDGGAAAEGARADDRWARPGMSVTFRVSEVRPSMRVLLAGFVGEHAASEFEPLR